MGIFLIIIGLAGILGAVRLGVGVIRIARWPTAQATVVERGVGSPTQPTGGTRNARFVATLRYHFKVDGALYEGHAISPVQKVMTAESAQEAAKAFPDRVEVHYDPKDPSRVFIETGSLTMAIIVGVIGLLATLGGLGAILSGAASSG